MIDWLLAPAFHAFGAPFSRAELLGFATGVVNVGLLVRQHAANWPLGIVNVLLLLVVFWTTGLFADAALQLVYVALGAYGWWYWLRGGPRGGALAVRRTSAREWGGVALFVAGATGALWLALTHLTPSTVPLPDALTTALSLAATYGQARKLLESWWIWIAADVVYIPLYAHKGLWLTALLYLVFLGLCVAGLRAWRADLAAPRPA